MIDIRYGDALKAACELVVIPISTKATFSSSFEAGLHNNKIEIYPKKEEYKLGEIEIHKIEKHKIIKYIAFSCTVAGQSSSYEIVSKIASQLATKTKSLKSIKKIAVPLLGTGAGRLNYASSLDTIFKSFYRVSRLGVDLVFCIPDSDTFQDLRSSVLTEKGVSIYRVKQLILENIKSKKLKLDLGNCGLNNFDSIPELFDCLHLQELIISNEWGAYENGQWVRKKSINKGVENTFAILPDEIKKLKNLKVFIAGGNWNVKNKQESKTKWKIKDISPVSNLSNLVVLNLSNNAIETLGNINKLVHLQKLYLNNNKIAHFPEIKNLKSLKELYISNNMLEEVEFLKGCVWLKTLDLHANQILNLTPIKSLIAEVGIQDSKWTINTISIAQNPLITPRPEVIRQGKGKVLAYFEQEEAERKVHLGAYINQDIKLILVGNSYAGKSSLLYWLKHKKPKKDIATTHWLDIDKFNINSGNTTITIRTFDFGGQEYYHDTHHLFFTNQTIYLVIWEKDSDEFNEIEVIQKQLNGADKKVRLQTFSLNYWLDSIRFFTQRKDKTESEKQVEKLLAVKANETEELEINKAPTKIMMPENNEITNNNILVIQNKVDSHNDIVFLDQRSLKNQHDKIFDFATISVHEQNGLDILENKIVEVLKSTPLIGKSYLKTWGVIKSVIENRNFEKPHSIEEFRNFCNDTIKAIPEVQALSNTQISKVLFNRQDAESFAQYLNDIGILLYFPNNKTIGEKVFINQNKILINIYNILLDLEKSAGEFDLIQATKKLEAIGNKGEVADTINLMLQFKIIFEHPNKKETYIAPLFLPQEPLESITIFSCLFEKPIYKYQYKSFIHKNVILDFFNVYGKKTLKESKKEGLYYFWRCGIIIKDDATGEISMVKFNEKTNEEQYAFVEVYALKTSKSDEFLKKIANDLDEINDGWNVLKMVSANGKDFVPINIIHENEKRNNWLFHYQNKTFKLTDFKKHLLNPIKMKKVFISYSKADAHHLQKLENHLSILKRNGTIATWNCRKLLPGEKWDGKIKNELEEANLILFLISDDFLATDYIWDIEIKRAIDRDNDPNDDVTVIPIIVRACDWEDSPLGVYNTAPKKAEVIASSVDIDVAWTKVVKELKTIL